MIKTYFALLTTFTGGLFIINRLPAPAHQEAVFGRPPICISAVDKKAVINSMDTARQIAPLLEGLGDYKMEVTSSVPEATRFFHQGFTLYYGFNHLEAFRSFKEATRLDPEFAMAYWGMAMSLGPNINAAMDPADGAVVYEAVQNALRFKSKTSEKERALIDAVSKRYIKEAPADRSSLDLAYADAMKDVAQRFPNDVDVISLLAEALMDLHPWDYFLKDGTPQPWTQEILQTIERAMALNAKHPGANHFYIHAYEASTTPGKAMASADLLRDLVPAAGHLVHMPSHIYIRTGRYQDGVIANQKAVKTDEQYIAQCKAEGFYPLVLYPHNIHFLWACATLDGQSAVAIKAADMLAAKQNMDLMLQPAWSSLQHFHATPYYARVRFGKWDEILRLERPDDRLKYSTGIWRYARAVAYIRKGKLEFADKELKELKAIGNDPTIQQEKILGVNPMVSILQIAEKVVEGEWAASQNDYARALAALTMALKIEDGLLYQEPYDWHHPVREILGDVLLQSGDAALAERYFKEDLYLFANNGWALTGLKQALEKQGKKEELARVQQQLATSFARADIQLKSARF